MIYPVAWYAQNFLAVLGTGKVPVPEVFLMTLVFLSLFRDEEDGVTAIWAAFLGGVVWDLRWTGFPGASSLVYVATLMTVRSIWRSIPMPGRTISLFGFLLWCANMPVALGRILLWGARGAAVLEVYFVQQSYILPLVLLGCAAYAWRLKNQNV